MYTNRVFGTAKCVLFLDMSSFQSVPIKGVLQCTKPHPHGNGSHDARQGSPALVLQHLMQVISQLMRRRT